jgi:hypothetical protein
MKMANGYIERKSMLYKTGMGYEVLNHKYPGELKCWKR